MASEKHAAASRRNAEKSTGPRTESGKARSSRNALKHGLSAEQVVIFDEDPAAFDNLRDDLYALYQPADPVAENLVEQVAACIWRLRRVPQIEAGIFEHHYGRRQEGRALLKQIGTDLATTNEAKDLYEKPRPVLGEVFEKAERSLNSLIRIAGAIEGSLYRAIRELERIKAQQEAAEIDDAAIDLEAGDAGRREPSKPRLFESNQEG